MVSMITQSITSVKSEKINNASFVGQYSSKRNPCPVCGNTSGKCRANNSSKPVVYCYGSRNLSLKEVITGYDNNQWIALSIGDFSATMAIYEPWQKTPISTKNYTRTAQKPRKKPPVIVIDELQDTINELDKKYEKLLNQLTLSDYAKTDLLNRLGDNTGDMSVLSQYRSVSAKTRVKLDSQVAGLIADGDSYRFPCHGYQQYLLIPIKIQGKCVGLQLRNTDKSAPNRYTFVSRDGDFRLYNEQPRHIDIRPSATTVYVAEGYLKAQVAASRHNISVLGAGRSWHNNSLNHTKIVQQHLPAGSNVTLCIDAGDVSNRHVMPKWLDEYTYFSSLGYSVSFGLCPDYETKNGYDIDEIESIDELLILSRDMLFEIHPELIDTTTDDDADDDLFIEFTPKSSSKFSKAPNIEVKTGYIGQTVDGSQFKIPQDLIITGSCGSGKTQFIKQVLHANRHIKHLSLAHLNNLGYTQAASFSEQGKYVLEHHIDLKNREIPLSDARYLVASIVTALDPKKFNITHFSSGVDNRPEPYLLLIDEIAQLIEQLANFSPFKRDRLGAWERLCDIIRGAERIVVSDRAMTDEIYNWLCELRKREPLIISHTAKKQLKNEIKVISSASPAKTFETIVERAVVGEKIICGFESKERAKQLELMLVRAGVTNIININADIDPQKKDIIKNIETSFGDYQVVLYTKTLGTGVSLVGGDFKHKYMFFSGSVLTAEDMVQMMSRHRDDIPVTIWLKSTKKQRDINSDETSYGVIDTWREKIELAATSRQYSSLLLEMQQNGYLPEYRDSNRFCDENKTWLTITSKIQERINATKAAPLLALLWEFKKDGIKYTIESETKDKLAANRLKKVRTEIKIAEANEVLNAHELKDEAYELYRHSPDAIRTIDERYSYQKTKLIKETGWRDEDLTADLVMKELERNPLTARLYQTAIDTRLSDEDLKWLDAKQSNRDARDISHHRLRANLKKKLGLKELLDMAAMDDFIWDGDSPLLQDLVKTARENADEFKRYIGMEITPKTTNIKIINAVIRTTGLEPEPVRTDVVSHELIPHPLKNYKKQLETILDGNEITSDAISAAIIALEPCWADYKQLTHKSKTDTLKTILEVYGWKLSNARQNTYRLEKIELPKLGFSAGELSQQKIDELAAMAKQIKLPSLRYRDSAKIAASKLLAAMGWVVETNVIQKCNKSSRLYKLDRHSTDMVLTAIKNAPIKTLDNGYESYCKWMSAKATEPVQAIADMMVAQNRLINISDDDDEITSSAKKELLDMAARANQLPCTARARLIEKLSDYPDLVKLIMP